MSEANNGQDPALKLAQARPKRHNAKFCPLVIRERIVNALADGDSRRAIARALRVSPNTVTAVAEEEWRRVDARKARIAAQSERNATRAAELIAEKLEGKDPPLNVLVPVFGVSVDKALALRGDSQLRIAFDQPHQHIHAHITPQSLDEILAHLPSRNDPPQLPQQGIHAPEDIASE
jgi:Homeodomain-like domain